MRLAVVATVIFVAGLWPGLARSTGPVRDTPPRVHAAAVPKLPHPVLVRVADLLRVRF
jgi:hypothetical protein